jgi:hypothetical protein
MALTVIPRGPAFDGQIACQRFYRRLAGGIERIAGQPFAGTHRRGADQPSATAHVPGGLWHGKELSARLDGKHMVEVLHTHLVKGCEVLNAGVTHQDIELAILLKRLPHQALDVRDIAPICLNGESLTATLPARARDLFGLLGLLTIIDHDGGTLLCQLEGNPPSDATTGPGDNRDFSCQSVHQCSLLLCWFAQASVQNMFASF